MGDIVSSVADIFGFGPASIQADAATQASNLSAMGQAQALALQQRMYEEGVARQKPFYEAGVNALTKMQEQYGNMPAAFTGKVDLGQDPGYAFRMSEGMKALERSAAARGGLLGGATLKGAQRFGQDLASQEYQNAYNRALTQYNAAVQREGTGYNRLAALAGVGQTATSALSSAAGQTGANLGNLYYNAGQSAGASRASGYMGMANTLTGGIGTGLNYYQNQQLMNRLLPQQTGVGSNVVAPQAWQEMGY